MRRLSLRRTAAIGATLALAACVNEPPAESHQALGTTDPGAVTASPTTTPGPALELREPAVALLSPASRAELEHAGFPFLVLGAEHASRSTVLCEEHWCSDAARFDGYLVTLYATDVWHEAATPEDLGIVADAPMVMVHGRAAREIESEDIVGLVWNEHDVAYSLEVECESAGDTHCASTEFLQQLARSLVWAHQTEAR